jgi:hypothetical protein
MKSVRFMLYVFLMSLCTVVAFAQSDAQKPVAQSNAQKSFTTLRTLAGSWAGSLTTVPPEPSVEGKPTQVSLRSTSMGNALIHEMRIAGRPDDPITMLYLDGDRLLLTHYCDSGNRPRMAGKISPDGKTVEFDFVDVSGGTNKGHMHHAVFTIIDANHHTEDWTYMLPGDTPVRGHFDLQRILDGSAGSGK